MPSSRPPDKPSAEALAHAAAEAAASRRARNVTILDLRGLAAFTDFFVICTATSDTHAAGIADIVEESIEESGTKPWHREGSRGDRWMLLDYIDVVVHVFLADAREFYGLERLWADASPTVLEDDEVQVDTDWEEDEADTLAITRYTAMDDLADEGETDEGHEDEQ